MATVALIVFVVLVPVIVGICLIATSRRTGAAGPRCGHCGYNLTGSTSNRCPECGKLFIEAGVATNAVTSRTRRRWFGIALVVLPLIPTTFGFATTMYYRAKAARQALAAEKAKAAAVSKFLGDMLATQDPTNIRIKPRAAKGQITATAPRAIKWRSLDAVIQDVLTNPELERTREFYGEGDTSLVEFVQDSFPERYSPLVSGVEFREYGNSLARGRNDPRRLVIRLGEFREATKDDRILFKHGETVVEVQVFNGGGGGSKGIQTKGACIAFYAIVEENGAVRAEFRGALDP